MRLKTLQRPVIKQDHDCRQGDDNGLAHQGADKEKDDEQISCNSRLFCIINIKAKGQHKEESAQDIFSFGNPDN